MGRITTYRDVVRSPPIVSPSNGTSPLVATVQRFSAIPERFGIARSGGASASQELKSDRARGIVSRRTQAAWLLAFLGFPLGGAAAFGVVGSVDTIASAAIAGAVAGAVIGVAQWLVLRRIPVVSRWWIAVSSVGLAAGLALGVALFGNGTGIGDLLVRGVVAGSLIGSAQWFVLRQYVSDARWWIPVVAAGWGVGWTVTWGVGVDVSVGWAVFGASGAIAFQVVTGGALRSMVRPRRTVRE